MKNLLEKIKTLSLIGKIVIGIVVGAVLALLAPNIGIIKQLGTLFVGALKAIAPILVFLLVTSAIAGSKGNIGSRFKTVIFLYIISTFCAAVVAVVMSMVFPVKMILEVAATESSHPDNISQVLFNILNNLVSNPVASLANGNYVGVLFWAIVFGFGLKKVESETTRQMANDLSEVASNAVRFIISLAPFGVMGLVYAAVSESGLGIFQSYGKLILVLVVSMLIVALVVNPLIIFFTIRRNPYPLVWRCIKESGVTAFFTRSSAANIPVNMALCERLGLDRDFYSVSIPLGSTVNMDGAAITITIMTLSAAYTLGINVDIPTALILSLLATVGACGASGVAGGSLLLIPMAASLFGISNEVAMQVVAVGFIISFIQDSMETALNSSADVMFTAAAEYRERMKKKK